MKNDLISREALKKEVSKLILNWNDKTEYGQARISSYEFVLELIDNAPTVEIPVARWDCYCEGQKVGYEKALSERPHGEWILVSEKLPFNYVLCLFCDKEGNIFYGHRKSNNLWYEEYQNENISDVIAWQPLPKPYKKGE